MRIAAVLPAFNAARHIREALDSVAEQPRQVDEIVVADDASSDNTLEIVDKWSAENAIPLKIVRLDVNSGAGAARNLGFRNTSAEFVAMLDADDFWRQAFVERVLAVLENHPDLVAAFCYREYFAGTGSGQFQGQDRLSNTPRKMNTDGSFVFDSNAAFALNLPSAVTSCSAAIVRRRIAVDCGLFDPAFRTSQDREFFLRLAARGSFGFVPQPLSCYRIHDSNTTNPRNPLKLCLNMMRVLEKVYETRTQLGLSAENAAAARRELDVAVQRVLYASSKLGIRTLRSAAREIGKTQGRTVRPRVRHFLRAVVYSIGSVSFLGNRRNEE